MLIEVDLGQNRQATIPLSIRKHELTFQGEVAISIIPATVPTITKVNMVDC